MADHVNDVSSMVLRTLAEILPGKNEEEIQGEEHIQLNPVVMTGLQIVPTMMTFLLKKDLKTLGAQASPFA